MKKEVDITMAISKRTGTVSPEPIIMESEEQTISFMEMNMYADAVCTKLCGRIGKHNEHLADYVEDMVSGAFVDLAIAIFGMDVAKQEIGEFLEKSDAAEETVKTAAAEEEQP